VVAERRQRDGAAALVEVERGAAAASAEQREELVRRALPDAREHNVDYLEQEIDGAKHEARRVAAVAPLRRGRKRW